MAEHFPSSGVNTPPVNFFLTRQLAAPHQLGIKTEAICNQQLSIGGGELVCLPSVIQPLHVSEEEATGFFSWRREIVLTLALASLPLPHPGIMGARDE